MLVHDANTALRGRSIRSLLPNGFSFLFEVREVKLDALASNTHDASSASTNAAGDATQQGLFTLDCACPTDANGIIDGVDDYADDRLLRIQAEVNANSGPIDRLPASIRAAVGLPSTAISLSWPVELAARREEFHLSAAVASSSYVGRLIDLGVRIFRVKATTPVSALSSPTRPVPDGKRPHHEVTDLFSISFDGDPALWMIAGKQNATFRLQPGHERKVECTLIPLASGYLPLPDIVLREYTYASAEAPHVQDASMMTGTHVRTRATPSPSNQGTTTGSGSFPFGSALTKPATAPRVGAFEVVESARVLQHVSNQQVFVYPTGVFMTGLEDAYTN